MHRSSSRRILGLLCCSLFLVVAAAAQQSDAAKKESVHTAGGQAADPPAETKKTSPVIQNQGRILGILPNYKTVPSWKMPLPALSAKGKFELATLDSFDWSSILVAGYYAGTEQMENQYTSWGQGTKGFARRFAAGYADNAIGDYMTEAIFPVMLHEDPRYYRRGEGGFFKRTLWAMSRIVVTRNDAGGSEFNFSEFAGNAVAAGVSTAYYPAASRTASQVFQKWYTQVGTDAFFNVLKEFWPDVKQKFSHESKE